jgi:hypothetical protein
MQEKLQAWIDKMNEWGARVSEALASAFAPRPRPVPVRIKDERARRTRVVAFCAAAALLASLGSPAQARTTPKKHAAKKPAAATQAGLGKKKPAAPAPKPAPTPIQLGATFSSTDFARLFVGNQAGLLKIYTPDHKSVVFIKDAEGTDMVGVDGTMWAPVAEKHRKAIFEALGINESEVGDIADKIITHYKELPLPRHAIAILGIIGSMPKEQLTPERSTQIREFLTGLLASEKNVAIRRQAVLALALCAETDEPTVKSVITFMTASHNAWETFTTRQFFEYHKDYIRSLPDAIELRQLLEASGNPYSDDIAASVLK